MTWTDNNTAVFSQTVGHGVASDTSRSQSSTIAFSLASSPSWLAKIQKDFERIALLRRGWDGFDGVAPRYDTLFYGAELLNRIMSPDCPAPHVALTSAGGLLFHWIKNGFELELIVDEPGNVTMLFGRENDEEMLEQSLAADLRALWNPLESIIDGQKSETN
jgi:hypothetical protein